MKSRPCRRSDRIRITGEGQSAEVERTAACLCGWVHPDGPSWPTMRDAQYARHREETRDEQRHSPSTPGE